MLPDGNGLKIIQGIPQSAHQIEDTVNVVTTKKHLKFGNSVTAEWMANDQLSISDASEGDRLVCFVKYVLMHVCTCMHV